jgi:betaine-aldehyde dehydrogenase
MITVRHFIGGEWADSADGATFESVSPIDNTVIAQVARGGVTDAPWRRPAAPSTTARGRK